MHLDGTLFARASEVAAQCYRLAQVASNLAAELRLLSCHQERLELRQEAIRALGGYVATGLRGFKQKAVDRLNVLGVYVSIDGREHAETVLRGLREGVIG